MEINEKINIINFASRKAASVKTSIGRAEVEGYAQALCHTKFITDAKFKDLISTANKAYQDSKK